MSEFKYNPVTGMDELVPGTSAKPPNWDGEVATGTENGQKIIVNHLGGEQGPLSDLYSNPYSQKALYYPKDLGQLDKGHSIQFDIKDVDPADFKNISSVIGGNISDMLKSATTGTSPVNENMSLAKSLEEKATALGDGVIALGNKAFSSGMNYFNANGGLAGLTNIKPQTTKTVSTIRLYMPDSLSFGYSAQYDKLSVSEAINSVPLVGQISKAMTSFVSDNDLGKMITNKLGYTFNPQQQTLFEGIDFREFELEFVFTPTSKDEAITVQHIIKEFRRAAAPTKVTAAGGFFWVPPSIFNVSFFFNSAPNLSIPPIRPCVLQNVNVNLAPNGWAALNDGSPVQTSMTLSFKELDLVDRDSINKESTLS